MMKLAFTALAGLISSLATAHPTRAAEWSCDRSPLLLINVRAPESQEPQTILISDGVIVWAGPAGETPEHSNARIMDGRGATALPGLIDSHVHFDSLPAAKHMQSELDTQTEIFPLTMRQTLASGVTTARTHLAALGDLAIMDRIAENECFPAPRLILSGPGLLGGAPDVQTTLMRGVAGSDDAQRKIEEVAGLGAEWAALHGLERFSDEELTTIFDAAKAANMKIMADTDSFEGLAAALDWPVISGEYINRSLAKIYPPEILEAIVRKQKPFYVVPPVGYYYRTRAFARSDASLDGALFQFAPSRLAEEMKGSFREAFEEDSYIADAHKAFPTYARKLRDLRSAGAAIVAGSDSGSLGQFHYEAIWNELEAQHALGSAPGEVIAAATSLPAVMLDRPRVGKIAPGGFGDLVLYSGDIAAGDFSREKVSAVIKGGIVFVKDGEWVGPDTDETVKLVEQLQNTRSVE